VLEWCPLTEPDDFSDLHLQFAFAAIRNLQARAEAINLGSVEDELFRLGYIQVDMLRVGNTAHKPDYNHQILVELDARWLRRLANRRRNV